MSERKLNVLIDDDSIQRLMGDALDTINASSLATYTMPCPRCDYPVRRVVVARASDVEGFQLLMRCANEVMERHGIKVNLLADIRAQCVIAVARRNAGAAAQHSLPQVPTTAAGQAEGDRPDGHA